MTTIDTDKLTRVSLIDHTDSGLGLVWEKYNIAVEIFVQDDGRTLKVFVQDRDEENSDE